MRSPRLLLLALTIAAPRVASAADAPHVDGQYCSNCHLGHSAPGAGLTKFAGNFSLCQDCHTDPKYTGHFGFPWALPQQAVPGVAGRSHSWSADASGAGATPPSPSSSDPAEAEMGKRLDAGKIMCSTCHDQHQSDVHPLSGRGTQHVSAVTKTVTTTGSGTVAVSSVPGALAAKGYVLQFTTGGAVGTAVFRVSNDREKSWIQEGVVADASVALADGVVLAFGGGSFAATEEYELYVSYPFLRVDNTDAKMCITCHKDRNMTAANVQGTGDHPGTGAAIVPGTTVMHHPVDAPMAAAPLDASGGSQASGDGNPTNDLRLGTAGKVTCLTCHRVHNADSNSLSMDP